MDDFEARQAEWEQLHRQAVQVGTELVGLNVEAAQAKVAQFPGLSVRFVEEGEPVAADFQYGRITACTRDGVIVGPSAG